MCVFVLWCGIEPDKGMEPGLAHHFFLQLMDAVVSGNRCQMFVIGIMTSQTVVEVSSLTLSEHAREGYSSHFVCLSAFLLWRRRRFQG